MDTRNPRPDSLQNPYPIAKLSPLMNISTRCDYACRALVELARVYTAPEPVTATQIAERRQIPEKYLVHIMLQLKRAGLVQSVRGAQGGYRLARTPDEITLLEAVESIDGPLFDPLPVEDGDSGLRQAWQELASLIANTLRGKTLRDIADHTEQSHMYYI